MGLFGPCRLDMVEEFLPNFTQRAGDSSTEGAGVATAIGELACHIPEASSIVSFRIIGPASQVLHAPRDTYLTIATYAEFVTLAAGESLPPPDASTGWICVSWLESGFPKSVTPGHLHPRLAGRPGRWLNEWAADDFGERSKGPGRIREPLPLKGDPLA